jgi:putative transposase
MHVVQRGNNRLPCFFHDDDCSTYRQSLQESSAAFGVHIHAYVLMTNHVHLLLTAQAPLAVSKMMQALGRRYVRYINGVYRRTGTLWEGRFKSSLIDTRRYLLTCYRYIELNPVRAAMVASPADYRWSSYAHNALGKTDYLVTPHSEYTALAESDNERCAAYLALFKEVIDTDELAAIRAHVEQERALGSLRFQAEIEAALARCVHVRGPGRPRRKENVLWSSQDLVDKE